MKLPGGDSDDGSILGVEFDELKGVLPTKDEVVVQFIPGFKLMLVAVKGKHLPV